MFFLTYHDKRVYIFFLTDYNATSPGFEAVYTGPDSEFFLENLLPGTTYKLRVACISAAGHSPVSTDLKNYM